MLSPIIIYTVMIPGKLQIYTHLCELVLLDLTAAFDTVDHGILLKQMKSIGICESALAWIASYLSDRTLAIKIENAISR